MELYTSLTRLKQALGGADLPPMTPVPESVHHIIDPAFTIGYGALTEDELLGLRCPVRGCGEWHRNLTLHVNKRHTDIGGGEGIKRALSIPYSAPLMQTAMREQISVRTRGSNAVARLHARPSRAAVVTSHERQRTERPLKTVGAKNLINSCRAQLAQKLKDLRDELGHSPSTLEADARLGTGFPDRVRDAFGTWGNALAQCGLDPVERNRDRKIGLDRALESLRAYYEMHGHLPLAVNGRSHRPHVPVMLADCTIKKALESATWPDAMRKAASMLGIYGGRYGLPKEIEMYRAEKAKRALLKEA